MLDAVIKCNEEEKVLLKSVEILEKEVTTIQNKMPFPLQALHLTVESFKIPERLDYFFKKPIKWKIYRFRYSTCILCKAFFISRFNLHNDTW